MKEYLKIFLIAAVTGMLIGVIFLLVRMKFNLVFDSDLPMWLKYALLK